jgi:hypothetical protein
MKRTLSAILLVALALTVVSCGSEKRAATSAISAAETAWTAAKDNVMRVLPADGNLVERAIATAKVNLEQGDAEAALAAVQDLPARIQQLTASLADKEIELKGAWETLSAGLPGVVESVTKRVDKLAKSGSLPSGMDPASFDQLKTDVATATTTWTEAQAAQQAGNIGEAVAKALDVKGLIVRALTALKMPVPDALA